MAVQNTRSWIHSARVLPAVTVHGTPSRNRPTPVPCSVLSTEMRHNERADSHKTRSTLMRARSRAAETLKTRWSLGRASRVNHPSLFWVAPSTMAPSKRSVQARRRSRWRPGGKKAGVTHLGPADETKQRRRALEQRK